MIPVMACDANGRIQAPRWRGPSFVAAAPGIEVVAPFPTAVTPDFRQLLAAARVSGGGAAPATDAGSHTPPD